MIAENERKEQVAKRQQEREAGESDQVKLLRNLAQVAELSAKISRSKDEKISGWARTIASSASDSLSASRPSTVPSLESVEFAEGANKCETGASSVSAERLLDYEVERKQMEQCYEEADMYRPEDRELDFQELKDKYADVLMSPSDYRRYVQVRFVEKICDAAMLNNGVIERLKVAAECYDDIATLSARMS